MNREGMLEAATSAARQLISVFIDELESVVHDLRQEVPVTKSPVDPPHKTPKESETEIAAPEVHHHLDQNPVEGAQVAVRDLEPGSLALATLANQSGERESAEKDERLQELISSESPSGAGSQNKEWINSRESAARQHREPTHLVVPSVVRTRGFRRYNVDVTELPLIAQRSALKAESSRWAGQRSVFLQAGNRAEVIRRDRELIERATKLPNCYLWMNRPDSPIPPDLAEWEVVEGSFLAVAESVSVMEATAIAQHDDLFEQSLALAAASQSALRVAVNNLGGRPDSDQRQLHHWIRNMTQSHGVYLTQYMLLDDPADPTWRQEIVRQVREIRRTLDERESRDLRQRRLLDNLRHSVAQIQRKQSIEENWSSALNAVEELIASGLRPSNVEMRDILLPMIDELPTPELVPHGLRMVLREMVRYRSRTVDAEDQEFDKVRLQSPEVVEVARTLAGKKVVVIGGDPTPHAKQAIEEAFGLEELIWIETAHGSSYLDFAPAVGQPDVAVVLLAVRWASHSFGKVQHICNRYRKPLVRLPTGYNPNQVAAAILSQASDRLG